MAFFTKGDHVWIPLKDVKDFDVPIGAVVKSVDGLGMLLTDDQGEERFLSGSSLSDVQSMHPSCVSGVDDMIQLGELTEAGILRNLLIRYYRRKIYTHIGMVLVAVNPYQLYPIYDAEHIDKYSQETDITLLPPHIFSTAQYAFTSMKRRLQNQSIIISGESGAGKTESTKLILRYLTTVGGQHTTLDQQILDANPILEGIEITQHSQEKTLRFEDLLCFRLIVLQHKLNSLVECLCRYFSKIVLLVSFSSYFCSRA